MLKGQAALKANETCRRTLKQITQKNDVQWIRWLLQDSLATATNKGPSMALAETPTN